jgi:hypothetical protein
MKEHKRHPQWSFREIGRELDQRGIKTMRGGKWGISAM